MARQREVNYVFCVCVEVADVKLLHSVKLFKQITTASIYLGELVR